MSFRFDLVDLQLFLAIVEAGSITAGAQASQLSLASASARLLAMEDTLGTALVRRGPRQVQLTPAGLALVDHARTVLQRMERLQGELSAHARGMRHQLRLWCDTVALHEFLPSQLGDYLVAHPEVSLALQERPGPEVVAAVAEGAIAMGIVRENADVLELETHPLPPERLVLVTPRGHALAQAAVAGMPVALEQADGCDVIGLTQGAALQDLWDSRVAQRGRRLNHRVRVSSFDEQCRFVAAGAGVAVMPATAAQRHARRLPVEIVALEDAHMGYRLRLCLRRQAELPAHAQQLVSHLLRAPAAGGGPG
jgi:DNA-binding transcriptional LysR family regulator